MSKIETKKKYYRKEKNRFESGNLNKENTEVGRKKNYIKNNKKRCDFVGNKFDVSDEKYKETKPRHQLQSKVERISKHPEWQGRSAVVKFFPTELSDDDSPRTRSFSPDISTSPQTDRVNHKTPRTSKIKKQSKNKNHNSLPSPPRNGKNSKANINSLSDKTSVHDRSRIRSTVHDFIETSTIIRHRPTFSAKIEADYFTPRMHNPRIPTMAQRQTHWSAEKDVSKKQTHKNEYESSHRQYVLPMSVISERYQDDIFTPVLPVEELCRFGEVYETNLLQLIHKYLEIDTHHRVVYIGQEKGSIASQVEDYFCLIKGVLSVFPGKIAYRDVESDKKLLAFKIAHVGAEEFFAQATCDPSYEHAPFDRVIIHDAVQHFNEIQITFHNIMKVLHQFGKILIIHRPGSLNTLPYFSTAKNRLCENEIPYMKIITSLQKIGADVEWDLVHVPIVISTARWLAMLKSKYPPQMEIMSNYEIACGLRELSEGPLKYLHDDDMEIEDRLMFITASLPTYDCAYPSVQRVGGASQVPYSGIADAKYNLPITDEIAMFLDKPKTSQYKMKSLF